MRHRHQLNFDRKDISASFLDPSSRPVVKEIEIRGLLCVEDPCSFMELRMVMVVRSNYAPWVRNDHTGFEVMLGEMATFIPPEETAAIAKPIWADSETRNL